MAEIIFVLGMILIFDNLVETSCKFRSFGSEF